MFNEQFLFCEGDINISSPEQYHTLTKAGCSQKDTQTM